jgi:hypothetical protein
LHKIASATPLPKYIVDNKFIPKEGFLSHPRPDNPNKVDNRFASTDNPETFEKNLKTQPDDWHYRRKEISYKINSNGYRAKEWDEINWNEAIVVVGCSMTAGIGVAEDETITHYLSLLSGREVVNLGVASIGIDGMMFNNIALKRHYNPWAVVNLWTNIDRMIEFLNHRPEFHGAWTKSKYFKEHNRNEMNPIIKDIFYSEAVKEMWKGHRVYYGTYYETTSHYFECDFLEHTNSARDLLHCGRNDNRRNAEIIWQSLSRQN